MADFTPGHISVTNYDTVVNEVTSIFADAKLEFVIDGGGAEITTGEKGHLMVPCHGRVASVALLADQTGDIKIDIWRISIDQLNTDYPPTDANSITNGHEPEISGGDHFRVSSTGWSQGNLMNNNDILAFNVDSVSAITRCTIVISLVRSVTPTRVD